jgi:hypothetical protein
MVLDRLAGGGWAFAPALAFALALVCGGGGAVTGCGNSGHVDTGAQQRDGVLALGEVCDASSACASSFCLRLRENAQNAPGQCSQPCAVDPECGSDGLCRAEPLPADGGTDVGGSELDAGACFKACEAASDCAPGIPCVWQVARDAGFCQTLNVAPTLCGEIADASTACVACLAQLGDAGCCQEIAACVADVPCAKLETCSGTCASTWQSSGVPTAVAVGACAAARCPACQ